LNYHQLGKYKLLSFKKQARAVFKNKLLGPLFYLYKKWALYLPANNLNAKYKIHILQII